MNTQTRFGLILAAGIALAGCGASGQDSGSNGGSNVGFGGAQDIGQFRSILNAGGIPGPNTIDANGFFNEHFTELPDADCGQPLCGYAMLSIGHDWVSGEYQTLMQISLKSPIDPASLERLPLNMVVVVDTSGSMASDGRLTYVKQGLDLLIDQLQPGDRLGIVRYSSGASVIADLAEALDKETLKARVAELTPDGSTNIYDGLQRGFTMLGEHMDTEHQNRVMLLSDGLATAGNTNTGDIIAMSEDYVAEGMGLTTIGVGLDFNVDLMRGLAERGAGNFYFLENAQAIDEVFSEELNYFVTPIALDVLVEATGGSQYQIGAVAGTRFWKTEGNTGSVFVPAAFLASRTDTEPTGGRRGGGSAIFVRMVPNLQAPGGSGEVANVTLSYRLPGQTERIQQTITLTNPYAPGETPEQTWTSHAAMEKNYAIYNLYLGLHAAAAQSQDDYSCALATVQDTRDEAAAWNELRADDDISADIELLDQFAANLRQQGASADACGNPYTDPYGDGYGDGYNEGPYGCAAGGGSGGGAIALLVMALVLALVRRRRAA